MLGLADSNDPTLPIRWRELRWRGALVVAVGVFEIVYGAMRMPVDLVSGLIFMGSGVMFILLGVRQIVIRRRARGSDGGTGSRP